MKPTHLGFYPFGVMPRSICAAWTSKEKPFGTLGALSLIIEDSRSSVETPNQIMGLYELSYLFCLLYFVTPALSFQVPEAQCTDLLCMLSYYHQIFHLSRQYDRLFQPFQTLILYHKVLNLLLLVLLL